MHCRFIPVLVLGLAGSVQGAELPAVLEALKAAEPGIVWNVVKSQKADVTCDGQADTVIFGKKNKSVWVGIVSDGSKPQMMAFGLGAGRQASFCQMPVVIRIRSASCDDEEMGHLPGCTPSTTCKQFSVSDETCDSFHFYWDSDKKMTRWWRR